MDNLVNLLEFYRGKKVLITGHTGFKGSWLSQILLLSGAHVVGVSLEPATNPNLFNILGLANKMHSYITDVCNYEELLSIFKKEKPEIVFHLAAQPIVRESYIRPRETYFVNVMGTVNVCEAIKNTNSVKSFLNVTTDKVYENKDEKNHHFEENEKLDGYDPYSNSKSCSELVTHSYFKSFFREMNIATSTARAGNVIGGGDFANYRIIPDCYRSINKKETLIIRNPDSTRPYQHVLEPLMCYLLIAKEQFQDINKSDSYNVGPDYDEVITTKSLVEKFFNYFSDGKYIIQKDNGPHESSFLSLNNRKIKKVFKWNPIVKIDEAIEMTAAWYSGYIKNEDMVVFTNKQIFKYFGVKNAKI